MAQKRRPFVCFLAVFLAVTGSAALAAPAKAPAPHPDPYKKYRFRVRFDRGDVAGFTVTTRYFGSRGTQIVTLDSGASRNADFQNWASDPIARRDVLLVTLNEAGQQSAAQRLYACWPRDYQPVADLNAGAGAALVQHLRLECGNPYPAPIPPRG